MNPRESVGIALTAIRANKLRSFLTLLGTIIGVASVIAVISFVEGMNRYVTDKLLSAGANVLYVEHAARLAAGGPVERLLGLPVRALTFAPDPGFVPLLLRAFPA